MGAAVSPSHVVSAAPFSSGGGLLTLFPSSSLTSLSRETVLHKLLQCESFPRAAALHELLQGGSFPWGADLQGTGCSSVGPPQGHKPGQQTCSSVGSSLHGATDPGKSLLQCRLSTGSQLPSSVHLLWCGVLHGLQVEICLTVDLHGLQGHSLPHHGRHHELQGHLCSSAWSTSSPSFCTDPGVCRAVSHHLTPLFSCSSADFFSPLLNYVIPKVLPLSLMGSALASGGSVLEPAGTGSVGHGGSFWQLLTEATPVAPSLPKPCHTNPIHYT